MTRDELIATIPYRATFGLPEVATLLGLHPKALRARIYAGTAGFAYSKADRDYVIATSEVVRLLGDEVDMKDVVR